MNIYSHPGTKVSWSNTNAGYTSDQELAKKHLQLGSIYTVSRTSVGTWFTAVELKEVPGVAFNSVIFENV